MISGKEMFAMFFRLVVQAVEAVFSLKSMQSKILPPTLNLENPDVKTNINLIPHESITKSVKNIISNSFGFGGTNASLIFGL